MSLVRLSPMHKLAAVINANTLQVTNTISPRRYELFTEYEPFALLGTDGYETYAVYTSCTHNTETPLIWVAFAEQAYINGVSDQAKQAVSNILAENGISFKSMVPVDQKKCLQLTLQPKPSRKND